MFEPTMRERALDIARGLSGIHDPDQLIDAAQIIETYLRSGNDTRAQNGKIDFDAKLRENVAPNEMNWSGHAAELVKACNSGNVLVLKSRRTGFTRLMTEFFAHHTKQHGKTVLWLTNNRNLAMENQRLLEHLGADMTLIECHPFSTVTEGHRFLGRLSGYDFVFCDDMSGLSYSNDSAFLAAIMPMGRRFVFGSTAVKRAGVFYQLWENSFTFQKLRITWDMPLHEVTTSHIERKEELAQIMDSEHFKSEFMTEFREDKAKATDNAYVNPNHTWVNPNTAATPNTWTGPTTGGPWVSVTGTAVPGIYPTTTSGGFASTVTGTAYTGTTGTGAGYQEGPYTAPRDMVRVSTDEGTVDVSFGDGISDEHKAEAIQAVAKEVLKDTKRRKTTRIRGASFNDDDYNKPV